MQTQLEPREAGAAAQVQCSQRGRLLLQAAQHGQLRRLSACCLPVGQAQRLQVRGTQCQVQVTCNLHVMQSSRISTCCSPQISQACMCALFNHAKSYLESIDYVLLTANSIIQEPFASEVEKSA